MIQPVRTIGIAASFILFSAGSASAQRGGGALPRLVSAPAPAASGRMGVPAYASPAAGPTAPRGGNLPRLTAHPGGYRSGAGYRNGMMGSPGQRFAPGGSGTRQSAYTRMGAGANCFGGCVIGGVGGFHRHFLGSFVVGYPFWGPVAWPYFDYGYYGSTYTEPAAESYEPARAASKLIVVGGGTSSGGGDALTIEALGDSVRLSWLGANRPVREVKLFVADSARRELATRSASPMAPTATFEVVTLSAPVAFAGVTVTFADGAMTTTTIPYLRR